MKAIVLGGAGNVSSHIVKDLIENGVEVTVADIDTVKAKEIADPLGADVLYLNTNSRTMIANLVKGYDVAIGAVEPFSRFERKITEACLDVKVPYVSICDDYNAVLELYDEIAERAEKGDVPIITGAGCTPGITNVLTKLGVSKLEKVDSIDIAWSSTVNDAKVRHMFHTGKVPVYTNGIIWVEAGSKSEMVKFPEPIGYCKVCHVGHPEPVTIPKYVKVNSVSFKGGFTPIFVQNITMVLSKLGLTKSAFSLLKLFGRTRVEVSGLVVRIRGTKAGKQRVIVYGGVDKMSRLTSIPTSITAQMLVKGELTIRKGGIYAPEACIKPKRFLEELAKRGIKIFEDFSKPLN